MAKARTPSEPTTSPFPHPREQIELFGHDAAEQTFLNAFRTGRLHHAWLIGGPAGIGKATLAYRIARFMLNHPEAEGETAAKDLHISPTSAVAHQIAQGAHPDCHAVEHDEEKSKKLIPIGPVRDLIHNMQSTSGNDGWRVAIVDSVDALNRNAANALLKILEEPPPRCLFLLVAHQPGRVLATLRSRCQKLNLSALDDGPMRQAIHSVAPDMPAEDFDRALPYANGSVRTALELTTGSKLADRARLEAILQKLPRIDEKEIQQFSEAVARRGEDDFADSVFLIGDWCHTHALTAPTTFIAGLLAGYVTKLNGDARRVSVYNLDRKAFLVTQLIKLSRLAAPLAA